MFNKKSILVLFVDRNRFQFYGANLSGVEILDVPETSVRDLDIVNRDALYTLVKQWLKNHTLPSVQLVLIFAQSSYFEKTFPNEDAAQLETDIIKFFDAVPFESAITKVYDMPTGKRAVAINKALYEAIRQAFLLQGFPTKGVLTVSELSAISSKNTLDREMGDYVTKNVDTLVKQSIIEVQDQSVVPSAAAGHTTSLSKKSRLPLLLGVFGVLLIILIVVIFLF